MYRVKCNCTGRAIKFNFIMREAEAREERK
jgi:hypothetical protein